MKSVDIRDLPPCSFSPQCLHLLDDLDMPFTSTQFTGLAHIEDLQDEQQLRQLRSHVPHCSTCSALLADARRVRTEQRTLLSHFLLASEAQTSSTSGAIFAAIGRERDHDEEDASQPSRRYSYNLTHRMPSDRLDEIAVSPLIPFSPRPSGQRGLLQNILTLATVAAVILAAVGLLNLSHFMNRPFSTQAGGAQPHFTPRHAIDTSHGWDSMIIGLTALSSTGTAESLTPYIYNTISAKMVPLLSATQISSQAYMQGVSQDGQSLLYNETDVAHQQEVYKTYSPAVGMQTLYHQDVSQGQANPDGAAIWMDAVHVLVRASAAGAVVELNMGTKAVEASWVLNTDRLVFYHQPFLYFTLATSSTESTLYRANLAEAHAAPQRVASTLLKTRFWLSNDGSTVFYADQRGSEEKGIYAVGSDGTNLRLLRAGPGVPIGYGGNEALMLLQQSGNQVEVIQMGTTPTEPEHVVLANAAPDAISLCAPADPVPMGVIPICDPNVALEPYGHGLLLHAYYANGSHGLVYDNFISGTSQIIRNLAASIGVQLPGWSKITPAA